MGMKSAKKTTRFLGTSALTRPLFALGAASVLFGSGSAQALDATTLPQNPTVVGGKDAFSQSGNTLNVNQSTNRTVIDWRSFDIGSKAQVNFTQLGSSSIAVNRVNGSANPSDIEGGLHANGQVWILNPNGVFFGKGARVDAAGIVATTANINDKAFMAGSNRLHMTGADHGSVVNQGKITIGANGLAAFVAPSVRNSGTIRATVGRVALAAGTTYTLDLAGDHLVELGLGSVKAVVDQSGKIVNPGGTIALTAKAAGQVVDSVVNVSGVVTASSATKSGGTIILGADDINTTATASITADASKYGSGGTITAVANKLGNYDGTLSAKGGSNKGNGGKIETSGHDVAFGAGVKVTASAKHGKAGAWLVDPTDITIDSSLASTIETTLHGGTDANFSTAGGGTDNGDITLTSSINALATGGADLRLTGNHLSATGGSTINISGTGSALTLDVNSVTPSNVSGSWINDALAMIGTVDGGSTVNLGAGTYTLGAGTYVFVDKSNVTINGASESGTIIDATGNGQAYSVRVWGDNVSLNDFTVKGSTASNGYGIKVEPSETVVTQNDRIHNFSISDVAITGSHKNGLDLNGVVNATIANVSVSNTVAGTGIAVTDSANVTITGSTTTNNAWGGLALYEHNSAYNQQMTGISVNGTNTFNEATPIYMEDESASKDFGSVTIGGGYNYVARASVAANDSYLWFQKTRQAAIDFAIGVGTSIASVEGWSGSALNNVFTVGYNTAHTTALSIQTAVNTASAGDTINVLAGTYSEAVNINKSLTLDGANAGVNAADGSGASPATRGAETVMSHSGLYAFSVNAQNVTIDGFEFTGGNGRLIDWASASNIDGLTVQNNIFNLPSGPQNGGVIQLAGTGTATNIQIANNLFEGSAFASANDVSATWVYIGGSTANGYSGLTLSGNDFTGGADNAVFQAAGTFDGLSVTDNYFGHALIEGLNMGSLDNPTISGNSFVGVQYTGMQIGTTNGGLIEDNLFDGTGSGYVSGGVRYASGMEVWGGQYGTASSNGLTIHHNTFKNFLDSSPLSASDRVTAIYLRPADSGPGGAGPLIITDNTIQNNTIGLLANTSVTGSTVTGNIFSDNYTHVLDRQGAFDLTTFAAANTLDRDVWIANGNALFGHIQTAIDAASAGNTVNVGAGVYDETLNITKNLDIVGAGVGQTIIQPTTLLDTHVGHKYDADVMTTVFVNGASDVNLSGMTIDGNNLGNNAVVFWNNASGSISDVLIKNAMPFSGAQTGQDLAVDATSGHNSNLTISNVTFQNWNKNAIDAVTGDGSGANGGTIVLNVNDSTFTGRGNTSTIAQNGILLWEQGGGTVSGTVDGSTFSNLSYNDSANATAAAILMYGSPNGTLTVSNSTFASSVQEYISLAGGSTNEVDATHNNSFGGVVARGSDTLNQLYAIEDKLIDSQDDSSNGMIRLVNGQVYVTAAKDNIQGGIDGASSGDTVNIQAGTFTGQVAIDKNLTLVGAGAGQTIIDAPDGMTVSATISGVDHYAVVSVTGGATASISNLTVDGLGKGGNGNYKFDGIGIYNANATINAVDISRIRGGGLTGAITGSQDGVGVNAYNTDGVNRTITLENSTIEDFQKNATAFNGGNLTVDVLDNTITGAGSTGVNAQNGIQFYGISGDGDGIVTGTISGNTITGISYAPVSNWSSTAILLLDASGTTVSNNTVTGAGTGDYSNGIYVSGSSNVSITANTVTDFGWGVWVGDSFGTAGATVTNNVIAGNGVGVGLGDEATDASSLTVSNNSITGNTSAVELDSTNATTDFTGNWWGTANEAAVAAGMTGTSANLINFSTYLTTGTDTRTAAGFQGDFSNLTVTTLGAGSNRIAGAISEATAGGTIHVNSGTYAEAVSAGKQLEFDFGTVNVNSFTLTSGAAGSTLDGDLTATGAITSAGAVNLSGDFTAGSISLNGATTLLGDTTLDTSAVNGNITVASVTGGGHDLSINAGTGPTSLGNVANAGALSVAGAATLTGTSYVADSLDFGAVTLTDDTSFDGNTVTVASVAGAGNGLAITGTTSLGNVANAGALSVDGAATLTGTSYVADSIDFGGAVTLTGDTSLDGNTVAVASVTGGGHDLAITGTTSLGDVANAGALSVDGAATLTGTSYVADSFDFGAITLTGNTSLDGNTVTVASVTGAGNDLAITGTTSLGNVANAGALSVDGAATLTGTSYAGTSLDFGAVTLTGDTSLNGNTVTVGSVTGGGNGLAITGTTSLGNVANAGALSVDGAATLTGTSYAGTSIDFGAVTLTGNTSLDGNTVVVASITGGGHDLAITGTTSLGDVANAGALSVDGAATLTGTSYVADSMDFGAVTLTGNTSLNTSADNGAIILASVDGSTAGGQSLSLNAGSGSVSLGNLGAGTRLGAVTDSSATKLTGSTYNANSFVFGGDVTLTSASTTLNTTQSASAAGDITFKGDIFGTTNGGQSLTLIAGAGTGGASANGDITLQNVGTSSVRLNDMTVSGNNFFALTVWLADAFASKLTGNQVFAADTLHAGGDVNSNVGGDASGHIVSGGDVNVAAQGNVSGTISGTNVDLTGDNVNATVNATNSATVTGNTVAGSYTADTVSLNASSNVDASVDATTVSVSAPNGSVDGTWTTIDASGSGVVSLNGQPTVGLANLNPNQLVVEGFVLPAGTIVTASGELILPQGTLLGLLSPGGGKPKMILVHSVQQLGELLSSGYSVIVIDLSGRDKGKLVHLASN